MTSAATLLGKNELMRSDIANNLTATSTENKSAAGWLSILLVALALLPGCTTVTGVKVKDTTRTFDTVIIDAGHGGYDDGTKSRWGGKEKNNTLSVAQKLEPKLRAAGFKTVMTRRSDVFVELNERARISNRQQNAFFVSVHFNDSPNRKIRGTEVYYASSVSRPLAQSILSRVGAIRGCSCRFVKTARFRVLRLNEYPAVLVECGYLSNRGEGSTCSTSAHHERLAQAIADGIVARRGPVVTTSSKSKTVAATTTAEPASVPEKPSR